MLKCSLKVHGTQNIALPIYLMDMAENDNHPRPRRTRQESAKHYDSSRKDLQLSEVLDVLQCYVDYGGGINCCVCGKLYKSRVCFIKHLWEHTVYWDLFAGDKNHMRVLSIQAALILYGTCQQPLCQIPVDSLLVTSPHSTEHMEGMQSTPKKSGSVSSATLTQDDLSRDVERLTKTLPFMPETPPPSKKGLMPVMPETPVKKDQLPQVVETPPLKERSFATKRKAPPKLDFSSASKPKVSKFVDCLIGAASPTKDVSCLDSLLRIPTENCPDESGFRTPEKQGIPFVIPRAPKKKHSRRILVNGGSSRWSSSGRPPVNRCLILSPERAAESNCWKSAVNCKRKRAE